jgi:hypothetical protein
MFDWLRRFLQPREPDTSDLDAAIATRDTPTARGTVLTVHDIRAIANPWRIDKHGKRWSVKAKRRRLRDLDRVVYHQTAAVCGERPARYATLGAHYGIPASGSLIQVYDEEWWIWHAQGLSGTSIGVELDGRFYGIDGELWTIWDDPSTRVREQPTELTDAQVITALAIGRAARQRILDAGGTFRGFFTHRQSSSSRRNDPGAEPYRRIVRVLNDEFGYDTTAYVTGDGRAVCREWDERSGVKY